MIKNFYNKLLSSKESAILIFVCGILVQIITWPFLFIVGVAFHLNELMSNITSVLCFLWFFVPLISVGAIVISTVQISRKWASALTVIGLILNIVWLILFLLVSYFLFICKITV